jgi:predicted O-methyltransferase YrrM
MVSQLRPAAKKVVPKQLHPLLRRLAGHDNPLMRATRRKTDYERHLLVNDQLKQSEESGAIALSMGYPSWNLLYYCALCSLPVQGDPTIVETGTNEGLSTIVLAQALRDGPGMGKIHTVDLSSENVSRAKKNIERAGFEDLVEFNVGDSADFLRELRSKISSIDFAFLDASHEYADVMREFRIVYPLVRKGGTVYFDNASAGGVRTALKVIKMRYGGNVVRFDTCSWSPPGNAVWQPGIRSRILPF